MCLHIFGTRCFGCVRSSLLVEVGRVVIFQLLPSPPGLLSGLGRPWGDGLFLFAVLMTLTRVTQLSVTRCTRQAVLLAVRFNGRCRFYAENSAQLLTVLDSYMTTDCHTQPYSVILSHALRI